jgi:ribonuclease VapC
MFLDASAIVAIIAHEADAELLDDFLNQASVWTVPITSETGRAAVAAFDRYGRGRHPAALNTGDCFAYACARELGVPLLYTGE